MSKFPKQPTLLLRTGDDPEYLEGVVAECNALGWRVINLTYARNYIRYSQPPIGAVLSIPPRDSEVDLLRAEGIPIVCTSYTEEDRFQQDGRVHPDRRSAGRHAADALTERGFEDLAFIAFDSMSDPLLTGLKEGAEDHNATVHTCVLSVELGMADADERYDAQLRDIGAWMTDLPKPLAILAYNYRMGVRAIAASELAGYSVPEQVAVVCQGHHAGLCETAPVPLSAIDMNRVELGRQAVRLVKRMADGEAAPKDPIVVPIKGLVERRSTDIVAVTDPRVAKAIRFIWDHLDWPLKVEDVALEIGTSRNTIERAFRRCLNRGVNAELRRKRLEACKELLRSTKKSLAEISKATGFGSNRHLHRSFKEAYGMTPNNYRLSKRPSEAPEES